MKRAWIELNREALVSNIREYRRILPAGCKIMGVVKANAYGHGAAEVASCLEKIGVDFFAVATLDEAVGLRRSGIKSRIIILGYTSPEGFGELAEHDLIQAAVCADYARRLAEWGKAHGTRLKAHIALDTGMHRIGFMPEEIAEIESFYRSGDLAVTGIFSHLCVADMAEEQQIAFTKGQIERFQAVTGRLRADGIDLGTVHLLNSYGAVNYPEQAFDYARLGILMYGVRCEAGDYLNRTIDLQPVLTLKAYVTSVRRIAAGETVSYGRTFRAEKPTVIASVSIGYADGIPRSLSGGKLRAIIRGQYAAGVGRICMDQLMLDVTDISGAQIGDEVILIGRSGDAEIRVEELAQNAGSITNEILSRLSDRIEGRRFI